VGVSARVLREALVRKWGWLLQRIMLPPRQVAEAHGPTL
jgi:hypothetical protein